MAIVTVWGLFIVAADITIKVHSGAKSNTGNSNSGLWEAGGARAASAATAARFSQYTV